MTEEMKHTTSDEEAVRREGDCIGKTDEFEHPADTADRLENLPIEERTEAVMCLSVQAAAESVAEMEKYDRVELFDELPSERAAEIISEMSPDDAADVLDEIDEENKDALLQHLGDEEIAEIENLMTFDPDTAGGVMNTEIIVLDRALTTDQAIRLIREEIEDMEIPYYAYILDDQEYLVGVLSMRDLLLSRPGEIIGDIIQNQNLVAVVFDVDREEVARTMTHYNFLAIPVVDYEDRLLGVVTHDDIIDIIHEEATEDMQTMVGAASDETVDSPWTYSVVRRLPWLAVNMINSSVSAWVVHLFEGTIAQMAVLAVLMPMVANQAGNTGQQALAVMIRQLVLEKFDRKKAWMAVLRELKIGLANGILISIFVWLAVFWVTGNFLLSQVMAMALGLDMLIGAFAGAGIPLILKELGRDPAQASSIFLTTLTDSFGFLLLLGLAQVFLL